MTLNDSVLFQRCVFIGYIPAGPATATAEALRQAKLEIERNSIQTNGKLVWVVTDGLSNEGGNPIYVANQLKDMGMYKHSGLQFICKH